MAVTENTVKELSQLYAKRNRVRAAIETVPKDGAVSEMWVSLAAVMTRGTGSISDMAFALGDGGDIDNWLKEAALERLRKIHDATEQAIIKAGGEL